MMVWFKWGVLGVAALVATGCGPKAKPCADLQALAKPGMTEAEAVEAMGPPDETGLGLAGEYINYKCGGEGEFVSLIIRGEKVSSVVKIDGPKP